jgi:signal transduction histidine kinase/HAMP domain-containing protein/putative methionine-R-sulfoxide reductase with GAF domain
MKADVDQKGSVLAPGLNRPGDAASPSSGASIVRSRLFVKYVALLITVVVLALVGNGIFEVWFSYQEHKSALIDIQHQQAQAAADKIEEFITQIDSQVGWTTQLPWTDGTLDQRRFDALRLLRQVPAITELAQIDATGHEQLKVSRLTMDVVGSGIDYSGKPEFTQAIANKVYYGPVYFRRESEPYMTISLAGARRDSGVSVAQVNLKLIWDVVSKIKVGTYGRAYVVDADGRLIAHPDISLVLRNTDMSRLMQVRSARAGSATEAVQEADDVAGHRVLTAYAPVVPLGWFVFVETPIEEAYAPLYASIQRAGYVLFGALALAFIAGLFLARRMVVPIQALRAGAARIGSGDLSQRIRIKTGDEVEALANQFNDMAGKLQESYADLEHKVEQRTSELSEALEQQTATSEVLSVISSSPGELEPVFEAMLENAIRLCEAKTGNLFLYDGEEFRTAALYGASPAYAEARRRALAVRHAHPDVPLTRLTRIKEVIHIADVRTERAYIEHDPTFSELVDVAGARTLLLVPMLKENELLGAFAIYRVEVRPFTDKQIELVKNFAAQAVIAIENTRLLSELRQSLEQQTATADVLRVISSSPGDLQPVFSAMLENATRICEAKFGLLFRFDGEAFTSVAEVGTPPELTEFLKRRGSFQPISGGPLAHVMLTKRVSYTADYAADTPSSPAVKLGGARSTVDVPMLKDDALIGAFSIYRQEVRPFTDKQIELVQNFAAQAVIAIENTRLLTELRHRTDDLTESLEQQTAISEILRVISNSPDDVQPVLDSVAERAAHICKAEIVDIIMVEGNMLRSSAAFGELARDIGGVPLDRSTVMGRAICDMQPVQLEDQQSAGDDFARGREFALKFGHRTILAVPLVREGRALGCILVRRTEVKPFEQKDIALLTTFADQAAIAIENVRLFNAEQQRTEELSVSLHELRTAQDRLVQTEKLASLGQLTAGIAHEIKNPLNFVNNFSGVSTELIDELNEILATVKTDDKTRADIAELADTLRGNLEKIVQHGKRADSIVKNMLLHSREGSGEHRPVDINALVEESLNLAYHGARAEKQGFNITLERSFDPAAGEVDLYPQEVTRVLLNLISNGFYAAIKRKAQPGNEAFEPILAAATKNLGDRVEIRIRDNGTGIPPDVKAKMFNPFFTTKPAGEGTGLGLSISHDIIVKQHAGSIAVDTEPGLFTEFRIVLPRTAAANAKPGGQA